MTVWNAFGYLAASLTCTAFAVRTMTPLRLLALASNVAFILYGLGLGLTPVWLLHCTLLPLNAWRLIAPMRQDPVAKFEKRDFAARDTALREQKTAAR